MDKRANERSLKRVMVKYGTDRPNRTGFTKNLSATGVAIKTNNVMKPGATIQVEMRFPDRTFTLWARVVWAKKVPSQLAHVLECGMGLCFVDPPDEWVDYFSEWRASQA
jgi:hypothetical protein